MPRSSLLFLALAAALLCSGCGSVPGASLEERGNGGSPRLAAAELDAVLNTGELTRAQAVWFVLTAADALPGGPDAGEDPSGAAFDAARERGWLAARLDADSPARLGEVSLLIMKSFGIKGGLMYRLFPNPRYACRELVRLQIVQGRIDPGARLSGVQFLHILGNTLTFVGEDEALAAEEDVADYEGEFQLE
jgi:uncharacterized protein YceK